jgi:hypothetical protein
MSRPARRERSFAVVRGYAEHDEDMALAVIPAAGSSLGIETDHGLIGCCNTVMEWSPDDTSILVEPFDGDLNPVQQLIWDPSTGATHPSGWPAIGRPAWQRR